MPFHGNPRRTSPRRFVLLLNVPLVVLLALLVLAGVDSPRSAYAGAQSACTGPSYDDGFGHGTHVAGTIAARDDDRGVVGVAPGARIWAVKVLDDNGNGLNSCVIAGIDWVTDRRAEFNDGADDDDAGINISIANMSLGGGGPPSSSMCTAVANSVAAGVINVVAAGNGRADAATTIPGNCAGALTVSAYGDFDGQPGALSPQTQTFSSCSGTEQRDDVWACFSNFGPNVEIAAPGVAIMSTYPPDPNCSGQPCYAAMSGTSMATPHVAGAIALFMIANGYNGPADPASVMTAFSGAGYTRPQTSDCGFSGDPDIIHEPVLYLGPASGCLGVLATPSPSPTPAPSPTASPSPTPAPPCGSTPPASTGADSATVQTVPGRYIVTLRPNIRPETEAAILGDELGFAADAIYTRALRGFAADMSAGAAERLTDEPTVVSVEQDSIVTADLHECEFQTLPTGIDRVDDELNPTADITHTPGGPEADIDIAVIDTGVAAHPDLNIAGGVALMGASVVSPSPSPSPSPTPTPTASPPPTASASPSASPSATPTATPTPTASPSPSPSPEPTPSPTAGGTQGDADCDTFITTGDSLDILRAASEIDAVVPCPDNADVDCSGDIDIKDALIVMVYLAGSTVVSGDCPGVGVT